MDLNSKVLILILKKMFNMDQLWSDPALKPSSLAKTLEPLTLIITAKQGWEFVSWFSEQIARFLLKKEQMSDSLKKGEIHSFSHFW